MARGDPLTSPYVMSFGDYLNDPGVAPDSHVIRITVSFDNVTRQIAGAQVFRSADCLWTKIFLGLGVDGSPNSTLKVFDLSGFSGTRLISANTMSKPPYNVNTIEDFLAAGQITAGT